MKHAQWHKYTRKRGHETTYFVPIRGARRQICKTQFLHYFKISRRIVETVAKEKANVALLGFVWVKSGYSEAIAWRKVRLTKQRNADLTTDGLWAMPLNAGWVPVKARRRLQD